MFTGIVTEIGLVRAIAPTGGGKDTRIEIAAPQTARGAALGASIACSGVCLTVVDCGPDWFAVEASAETLAKTTLGEWRRGSAINLERALRMGDELGGHMVSGHVDGTGRITGWTPEQGSIRAEFEVDRALGRYLAPKGSVTVDGVSLTVNTVADHDHATRFGVNLIAHTRAVTNFGSATIGQRVNVEVDMLARYVDRLSSR
jgi:riboflavin synthase